MCESYLFTLIPLENAVALPNSSLIPRLFWSWNETSQFVQLNDQLASTQRTYVHFHCLIAKGLNYTYCCLYTLTPSKYDAQIHISHSDHDLQCTCFPFLPASMFGNVSCLIVDHKHTSGGRSFSDKSIDYHLCFWFLKNYKHRTQIIMEGIFQPKPYHHSCGAIIVVISEQYT